MARDGRGGQVMHGDRLWRLRPRRAADGDTHFEDTALETTGLRRHRVRTGLRAALLGAAVGECGNGSGRGGKTRF